MRNVRGATALIAAVLVNISQISNIIWHDAESV